jgi:hypothetical protein
MTGGFRQILIAALGVAALFGLTVPVAGGEVVPDLPFPGVASQEGAPVELGSTGGCVGGIGQSSDGLPVCVGLESNTGFGVHQLSVLTPGSIRVHLSGQVQFAGARALIKPPDSEPPRSFPLSISGQVTQLDPSDATISFNQHLSAGDVVTISVSVNGKSLGVDYVLGITDGFSIVGTRCGRRSASVTVHAATTGTLLVRLHRRGVLLGRSRRIVTTPGTQTVKLNTAGQRPGSCAFDVTLANASGKQRVVSVKRR